jgi:hypothetical protein
MKYNKQERVTGWGGPEKRRKARRLALTEISIRGDELTREEEKG